MINKIFFALSLSLLIFAAGASAFETVTPLGIRVIASQGTAKQFNHHWREAGADYFDWVCVSWPDYCTSDFRHRNSPTWDKIDWQRIDEFFLYLQKKHRAYNVDPKTITIRIMPLNYSCKDESSWPFWYEFRDPEYGCIDGLMFSSTEIRIHLGDDAGQEWPREYTRPFCGTALDHELNHLFLLYRGSECWNSESLNCYKSHFTVGALCE